MSDDQLSGAEITRWLERVERKLDEATEKMISRELHDAQLGRQADRIERLEKARDNTKTSQRLLWITAVAAFLSPIGMQIVTTWLGGS